MICFDQKWLRIKVALAAYAYEILNTSVISDSQYDHYSSLINIAQSTDNKELDLWFKNNYTKESGMWIHRYLNKERLHNMKPILKAKHIKVLKNIVKKLKCYMKKDVILHISDTEISIELNEILNEVYVVSFLQILTNDDKIISNILNKIINKIHTNKYFHTTCPMFDWFYEGPLDESIISIFESVLKESQ